MHDTSAAKIVMAWDGLGKSSAARIHAELLTAPEVSPRGV